MADKVTFYFDPGCPFAWVTSRWMHEVMNVRDVEVIFSPMSLAVLNTGNDSLDEDHQKLMKILWPSARVFAAVHTAHPDKTGELYTEFGTRVHTDKRGSREDWNVNRELLVEALDAVGLDSAFIDAADDESLNETVKTLHEEAMAKVGSDVGTPVLDINGAAFFGPVLTRVPRGEEAGTMFDGAVMLASNPHFFELKRSRTESPEVD